MTTQDLTGYTRDYYLRDRTFLPAGVLRPDQLAALCYALDWPFWGFEVPVNAWREPAPVLSIGAGRGELEREFERLGYEVVGVDPSVGAHELYAGTTLVSAWTPELVAAARTVVFCESVEHVPESETLALLDHVGPGTRVIVVNFPDYHPIVPDPAADGWDHITRVDDALYDRLAGRATRVVLRRASHLILDF